tara:strand:- start:276 stop:512 length:237 start_codon:yes stop_codon:yes gene_type:complete
MWKDIIKSEEVINLIKEARRLVAIEVNKTQIQEYKDIYADLMEKLGVALTTAQEIDTKKQESMDALDRDDKKIGAFWE